jgi:hypothetical protein
MAAKKVTAKTMIKYLQAIVKEYGDLPCCYAADEEGNGYSWCYQTPGAIAMVDSKYELEVNPDDDAKPNAIIVN